MRGGLEDFGVEVADLDSEMTASRSAARDLAQESSITSKYHEKKIPAAEPDAPAQSSEQGGLRFGGGSNEKSPELEGG